ncbi:23738_t:CDS:2, partial [Entrophospora sp. SA101]
VEKEKPKRQITKKTGSANQPQNDNPQKLTEKDLEKYLLEKRLELEKYFVFNLGELETMKTRPATNRNGGVQVNWRLTSSGTLTDHLTKLAAVYEKQFEKKGYELKNIPLRKNLICFLGSNFDSVDDLSDEYSGDRLDQKITILRRNNVFQVRTKHPTTTICDSKEKALEIIKTDPALAVIDSLAQKLAVSLKQKKFNGWYYQTPEYILLKPQTFMNNSGECVSAFISYFHISLDNLLVIYDDIALPLGNFRYRLQGSDGGHNGLKNIIELLGSKHFPRLRIGIGYDRSFSLHNWVLERLSAALSKETSDIELYEKQYGEAEEKELERKLSEIDKEGDELFFEVKKVLSEERVEQIGEEITEEMKKEILAERERNVPPQQPNQTPPPTQSPQQTNRIKQLEQEKSQLQQKIQELEQQLANSQLSASERQEKERQLTDSKNSLRDKNKELDQLKNNPSDNSPNLTNNNNNKLN